MPERARQDAAGAQIEVAIRNMTRTKGSFPTEQSVRKLLYLANKNITKKWTVPLANWALILNQLAIRYEDRWPRK
jgi:transposase-like protein